MRKENSWFPLVSSSSKKEGTNEWPGVPGGCQNPLESARVWRQGSGDRRGGCGRRAIPRDQADLSPGPTEVPLLPGVREGASGRTVSGGGRTKLAGALDGRLRDLGGLRTLADLLLWWHTGGTSSVGGGRPPDDSTLLRSGGSPLSSTPHLRGCPDGRGFVGHSGPDRQGVDRDGARRVVSFVARRSLDRRGRSDSNRGARLFHGGHGPREGAGHLGRRREKGGELGGFLPRTGAEGTAKDRWGDQRLGAGLSGCDCGGHPESHSFA